MIRSATNPRSAVMALGVLLVALAVYWPSAAAAWSYWLQAGGTTQYGMLIAALSIGLLYRARAALASAPVEPVPLALPALVAVGAGSMLFWRAGIETLQLALLPPLLFLAVLCALGPRIARPLAFALAFLYFGLPGWGVLWPSLQRLTIHAVAALAVLTRLPARFSGDVVTLPGVGVFEIGSKCSGVNFLVVGLAVAALIGELERGSAKRRIALLAIMGALALVSNWVRVFLIILIGYATHLRNPLATSDHLLFGWIVFAAALLAYLWLAPRRSRPVSGAEGSPSRAPGAYRGGVSTAGVLAAVAALMLIPAWVYAVALAQTANPSTVEIELPRARAPWSGPLAATGSLWRPRFVGAPFERQSVYTGPDGGSVEVTALGYARQGEGRELVNEGNSIVGTRGLTVVAYGRAVAGGQRFRELTAADAAGRRSIIWWVYDIGGHRFVTPVYSALWYGLASLADPPYSVLYALRARCRPSCMAARTRLRRFAETNDASLFAAARESGPGFVESHA